MFGGTNLPFTEDERVLRTKCPRHKLCQERVLGNSRADVPDPALLTTDRPRPHQTRDSSLEEDLPILPQEESEMKKVSLQAQLPQT